MESGGSPPDMLAHYVSAFTKGWCPEGDGRLNLTDSTYDKRRGYIRSPLKGMLMYLTYYSYFLASVGWLTLPFSAIILYVTTKDRYEVRSTCSVVIIDGLESLSSNSEYYRDHHVMERWGVGAHFQ